MVLLVRTDILEGGLKKIQVLVVSIYIHSTVQTTFHKVGKEFYSECLSDSKLNILKLSILSLLVIFDLLIGLMPLKKKKTLKRTAKLENWFQTGRRLRE